MRRLLSLPFSPSLLHLDSPRPEACRRSPGGSSDGGSGAVPWVVLSHGQAARLLPRICGSSAALRVGGWHGLVSSGRPRRVAWWRLVSMREAAVDREFRRRRFFGRREVAPKGRAQPTPGAGRREHSGGCMVGTWRVAAVWRGITHQLWRSFSGCSGQRLGGTTAMVWRQCYPCCWHVGVPHRAGFGGGQVSVLWWWTTSGNTQVEGAYWVRDGASLGVLLPLPAGHWSV